MLFKNTEKDLAAFVVPVFEVRIDDEVPKDKQELLKKVCIIDYNLVKLDEKRFSTVHVGADLYII